MTIRIASAITIFIGIILTTLVLYVQSTSSYYIK